MSLELRFSTTLIRSVRTFYFNCFILCFGIENVFLTLFSVPCITSISSITTAINTTVWTANRNNKVIVMDNNNFIGILYYILWNFFGMSFEVFTSVKFKYIISESFVVTERLLIIKPIIALVFKIFFSFCGSVFT